MNPSTITRAITADWGPALRRAAHATAAALVFVAVCAEITGCTAVDLVRFTRQAIEARSDQLARAHVALLGLPPSLPIGPPVVVSDEAFDGVIQVITLDALLARAKGYEVEVYEVKEVVTQRQAASPAAIAPPAGMDAALALVGQGYSQRAAARMARVPRTSLQRAIARG